ncbi:MAG: hypothetical protein KBT11_09130 [Treponema sp.]|nr:hypothetical protein [Candidatus Treponema equifaecale]
MNSQSWAKTPSAAELKSLVVVPEGNLFTAQENCYVLKIPGIEGYQVQTDLPQLPLGVKFLSSKKEEYFDEESNRGTQVRLWFSFAETGLTKLPPLIAKIKGRTYYLPFENVVIYENPYLISPVLTVDFADSARLVTNKKTGEKIYRASVGEEIHYQVCLQYFTKVLNYSWNLPKDAIFTETKRHEIQVNKEFTPQKFPVADFVWKPLKEGKYELPPVQVEAVSYNGSRKQLSLPDYTVSVENGKTDRSQKNDLFTLNQPKQFEQAFKADESQKTEAVEKYIPTIEDCRKLAELRSRELHSSYWNTSAKSARIEFEKSIGIEGAEDETKSFLVGKFSRKCGIFTGGNVSPVPEAKVQVFSAMPAQRVRMLERAGEWIFIENKNFSGWVNSSQVIEIK